jgi:hypothetical protein
MSKKGSLAPGQLADLVVPSPDYFSIPEEEIKNLESLVTIVGGKIVYAVGEHSSTAPPELPVSTDWSPVKQYVEEDGKSPNCQKPRNGVDRRLLN